MVRNLLTHTAALLLMMIAHFFTPPTQSLCHYNTHQAKDCGQPEYQHTNSVCQM